MLKLARRKFLHLAAGAAVLPALPAFAQAQAYPSRPITIVVPFPAGGSTDVIGRILVEKMRGFLGQTIIIENVGGAGGSIGVGRVARAAPDGYTLDIGQWDTHVANGATYPLSYDLQNDFEPVALISSNPYLILAKKTMPGDDLRGLVAWLKANPDKASAAMPTAGTQLAGILFQKESGTRFVLVPYRGGGPAIQDLVAGHIDMLLIQAAVALPQVRAGAIKAYATMAASRFAAAPTRTSHFGLVWALRPQRHAQSRDRQAQCCRGGCARRSDSALAACRRRARNPAARTADTGGTQGLHPSRNREVVAHYQGSQHQG